MDGDTLRYLSFYALLELLQKAISKATRSLYFLGLVRYCISSLYLVLSLTNERAQNGTDFIDKIGPLYLLSCMAINKSLSLMETVLGGAAICKALASPQVGKQSRCIKAGGWRNPISYRRGRLQNHTN